MSKMLDMLRAMDAFTEHGSGGVEELARDTGACDAADADEPTVTCHKCGVVVDGDTLRIQTTDDGGLAFVEPYCGSCLVNILERIRAWLNTPDAPDAPDAPEGRVSDGE